MNSAATGTYVRDGLPVTQAVVTPLARGRGHSAMPQDVRGLSPARSLPQARFGPEGGEERITHELRAAGTDVPGPWCPCAPPSVRAEPVATITRPAWSPAMVAAECGGSRCGRSPRRTRPGPRPSA